MYYCLVIILDSPGTIDYIYRYLVAQKLSSDRQLIQYVCLILFFLLFFSCFQLSLATLVLMTHSFSCI